MLSLQGYSQSNLDYSKIDFEFNSERFELIKWSGMERNATVESTSSSIRRTEQLITVESKGVTYEFEIITNQFDGIDKTTFNCKNSTIVKLIPGVYFSFTKNGDLDTEYYYGDLNK